MIVLGSDHVGYTLKEQMKQHLQDKGIPYVDLGCDTTDRVDYPVYAARVARAVSQGEYEQGMLFCGTGIGVSICANRFRGIRCVVCSEPYSAKLSRCHNDSNILALGARVVGSELAFMIADVWLSTPFEGGRHAARLEMMDLLERGERDEPNQR